MTLTSIALWGLVLSLGLLTGSAIFEARVLVPLWADDPPASLTAFHAQPRKPDSGRRLWMFLTPTTALISLFNLVMALMSHEAMRGWWIASSGTIVVIVGVTFAYFVPGAAVVREDGGTTAGRHRLEGSAVEGSQYRARAHHPRRVDCGVEGVLVNRVARGARARVRPRGRGCPPP